MTLQTQIITGLAYSGICTSDNPIATYGTLVDGLPLDLDDMNTLKDAFTDCANASGITSLAITGDQLSINNSPVQTNSIEYSQDAKISSQNTEQNNNLEQKKTPMVPLFNFNTSNFSNPSFS